MADKSSELIFNADISQFTKAISQMNSDIKLINSQFDASSTALDDWSNTSEGLEAKVKQLNDTLEVQNNVLASMKSRQQEYAKALNNNKNKLAELKKQYDEVIAVEGEKSDNAKKLAKQMSQVEVAITKNEKAYQKEKIAINGQQATINKTQKELKSYEKNLEDVGKELKETSKNTDEATESTGNFGNAMKGIGGGLAKGIVAIGAAAAATTTAFLALAESTREYREDINKLQTAFQTAGHTSEQATDVYKELYSVIGEEDRSVEAAQQIAKLSKTEEDMIKMTNIATGVWGTFGDSLPVEGLMENINATAKIGAVQGVLADALEWSGVNLDKFNGELEAMSSEEERAAHITNTLNGLYSEAADSYRTLNGDIINAREAQSRLTDAMAELGRIAEPIVTILKNGLAKTIEYITPLIARLGNAFELLLGDNKLTGFQRLADIFMDLKEKAQELFLGLLNGLTAAIPQIMPKIAEMLGQMVQKFVEFAPILLDAGLQLLMSLVKAIPPTIISLLDQLPLILDSVISALNEMIPALLEAAIQLLSSLISAIPVVIEKLVVVLPQLLKAITGFIQQNLPLILSSFMEMLMQIVYALPAVLQSLADALPEIIGAIVEFITTNLPFVLEMAIKLFSQIIAAIPVLIVNLEKQLPTIISKIIGTLLANSTKIWQMGVDLFLEIVKAIPTMIIELAKNLPEITETILDAFKDAPTMLFDVGEDIVEGLWDGIVSMGDWLWGKVTGFFGDVEGWAKDVLGIESPSKVFSEIGKYTAEGYEKGLEKEMKNVKKAVENNLDFGDLTTNGNIKLKSKTSASNSNDNSSSGKNVVFNYTVNSPKQLSRREMYIQAKKATTMLGGVI